MPEEAEEAAHRLRPMFCCLGEVTRADGSAVLCQGDTTVVCGVYGPAEVKAAREVIDRAVVEVCYKPRLGLPGVKERDREDMITRTCTAAVVTPLHPRTSISINIQEMQDGGGLASSAINSAILALLDASVPLSCMLAAVTVAVTPQGSLLVDPTTKQLATASSELLFVFSSRDDGVVGSMVEGRVGQEQVQAALSAARIAAQAVFAFYRKTIMRKFSKEA